MFHERIGPWVVYLLPVKGSAGGLPAVCTQAEWGELTQLRPGVLTLVRGGITNEGEAERLARGTAGDARIVNKAQGEVRRLTWGVPAA